MDRKVHIINRVTDQATNAYEPVTSNRDMVECNEIGEKLAEFDPTAIYFRSEHTLH